MRASHDKLEGDQTIADTLRLYGTIVGDASVVDGGVLELFGTITGSVRVLVGGRADVCGTVGGSLLNEGTARVEGVVSGEVAGAGATEVVPGAMVGGQVVDG
ncbi:MAG: hypothetical protein ACRDLM_06200 [Gaiellaceae bacterium]